MNIEITQTCISMHEYAQTSIEKSIKCISFSLVRWCGLSKTLMYFHSNQYVNCYAELHHCRAPVSEPTGKIWKMSAIHCFEISCSRTFIHVNILWTSGHWVLSRVQNCFVHVHGSKRTMIMFLGIRVIIQIFEKRIPMEKGGTSTTTSTSRSSTKKHDQPKQT